MHKIKEKNVPHVFLKVFSVPCHAYPPCLSSHGCTMPCCTMPRFLLKKLLVTRNIAKITRLAISASGQLLCDNCLSKSEREFGNFLLLKQKAKEK